MNTINTPQSNASKHIQEIRELIEWYDENSICKEDAYIKANLKLIINLIENVDHSNDIMFIDKITETFCDIIKKQRDVIRKLQEFDYQPIRESSQDKYVSPIDTTKDDFTNDEKIKVVFFDYIINKKKLSNFTANDYILRVQKLWHSFYTAYQSEELPSELHEVLLNGKVNPEHPLINAYNYIEELNCFISMKIATNKADRNLANTRAALNAFGEAIYNKDYKKIKVERKEPIIKDFSKYLFNGKTYGKSKLVLAVLQQYVLDYHPTTYDELEKAFPSALQGSLGVVRCIEDVSDKYKGNGGVKRYFIKEDEVIHLSSGEIVIVCTQWGINNTIQFINHVKQYGYEIKQI